MGLAPAFFVGIFLRLECINKLNDLFRLIDDWFDEIDAIVA